MDASDWWAVGLGVLGTVTGAFSLCLQYGPRRHADLVVSMAAGTNWPRIVLTNAGAAYARDVRIALTAEGKDLSSVIRTDQPIPVIAPGHTFVAEFTARRPSKTLRYDVVTSWRDQRRERQQREHTLSRVTVTA